MTSAVTDVQARIAAIQARFGVPPTPAAPARSFDRALATARADTTSPIAPAPAAVAGERGAVTGEDVVAAGRRYLGVPYVWGSTDPATGLDCSAFVQRAYADVGIELPRVSRDQARAGRAVPTLAEARPGDLLAFDMSADRPGVDHIGIYVGDGKMLVAPRTGDVVKVQDVTRTPVAIRRVLPDSSSGAVPYAELFDAAGARHGVDPRLLVAVARAESRFDPRAESPAGALGLMQLMPATAASLAVDPRDPAQAIDGAARLLARHLRRYGSVDVALAAYNAGPGAVDRYGGVPPFPETRAYVDRITTELRGATR